MCRRTAGGRCGDVRSSSISAALIAFILVVAVFPSLFTAADPGYANPDQSLLAPSAAHWFGTDLQGHDIYARTIYGARASITVGLGATLLVFVVGGALGALAGFYGGWVDALVSRVADVFFGIPLLLAAIVLMQVMHHRTVWTVIAILALFGWPQIARITRGAVLAVRGSDYVLAAKALGMNRFGILLRHVLPNAIGPVIAVSTIALGPVHRHRGDAVLPRGRVAAVGGVVGRRHQRRPDSAARRLADPVLSRWRAGDHGTGLHDHGRRAARRPRSLVVADVAAVTRPRCATAECRRPRSPLRRRPGGPWCRPRGASRPDRGDRRRVGFGEVHHRRGDPWAASARRANHRGPHRVRRRRSHRRHSTPTPRCPGERDRLRAAGSDDQPEPGLADRVPSTRSIACKQYQAVDARRFAGRCRHARSGTTGPAVSAPTVRRNVPAGPDRDRVGRAAAAADRRRADVGAGRHRAAPGARSPPATHRRTRHRGAADHP